MLIGSIPLAFVSKPREGGAWTPASLIGDGLKVWCDPDQSTTLNGSNLAAWGNTGSGLVQMVQTNDADRPVWADRGDGIMEAQFNGVNDGMATASTIILSTFSIWMIFDQSIDDRMIFEHSAVAGADDGHLYAGNAATRDRVFRSPPSLGSGREATASGTPGSDGVSRLWRIDSDGTHAGHNWYSSGVEMSTQTSGGNADDVGSLESADETLYLGCRNLTSHYAALNCSALVIVSPIPNAATIASMETYLAQFAQ